MTRSGKREPPRMAASSGVTRRPPGQRGGLATTQTFSRFLRNLARLESRPSGPRQKGGEGAR